MRAAWWRQRWSSGWVRSLFIGVLDAKLDRVLEQLHQLQAAVARLDQQGRQTMALADDILDEARQANTVGDAIIALVERLVAQSGGDPAKLAEALETLRAQRAETEAAILANTPQEPPVE
jgi:outer membrane murein-binding lipoprotein Lpp